MLFLFLFQIEYAATDAAVAIDIFIQIVYAKLAQGSQAPSHTKDPKNPGSLIESLPEADGAHSTLLSTSASSSEDHKELKDCDSFQNLEDSTIHISIDNKLCDFSRSGISYQSWNAVDNSISVHSKTNQYKFQDTLGVQNIKKGITDEDQLQAFWKTARSLCQGIIGAPYAFRGDNKGVVCSFSGAYLCRVSSNVVKR